MADVSLIAYADDGAGTLLSPLPMLDHNPLAKNDQIKSNDLADAEWTAVNVTVGDQDVAGLNGAPTSACTLTASAGNGTVIANAITAASGNHATKWYLKRSVGTGVVELTVDGGSTWQAITASLDADFAPGIVVDQAAVTNPQIGIRIVTSGDAVIVGNAECHLDSSIAILRNAVPIITTTVAITQAADANSLDILNHNNDEVCYYMEWSPGYDYDEKSSHQHILAPFLDKSEMLYDRDVVGDMATLEAANLFTVVSGLTYTANSTNYLAVIGSKLDNLMQLCINGVWSPTETFSGYKINAALLLMFSDYPMRMRGLKRIKATGNAAQKAVIDDLMP